MVINFSKTLEKKGVNDVRCTERERLLRELYAMSRGTTLFSRGTVETDRWLDLGRDCTIQHGPPCQPGSRLESLWDVLPDQRQQKSQDRLHEAGSAPAITSLIRDLSLEDGKLCSSLSRTTSAITGANPAPAAPPSKRQCRSLSFSDEFGGCRPSWRPQGSRVWTAVAKRRCHSGGSIRVGSSQFPVMQRSSSLSLPSRSCALVDGAPGMPCFTQGLPFRPLFTASPATPPASPSSRRRQDRTLRPLSLSHEHIGLSEPQRGEEEEDEEEEEEEEEVVVSEVSSPDSTPELGRRAGGLSRSRSQPCMLNDKKIGLKRRRPEDIQEQRPSLDLAKMTQIQLQIFQGASRPGVPEAEIRRPILRPLPYGDNDGGAASDFAPLATPGRETWQEATGGDDEDEVRDDGNEEEEEEEEDEADSSYEELDSDSACSVDSGTRSPVDMAVGKRTLWKGDCGTYRDIFQLGGELDLDQIERN